MIVLVAGGAGEVTPPMAAATEDVMVSMESTATSMVAVSSYNGCSSSLEHHELAYR